MKIFNLKALSVCVGIAFIGFTTLTLTDNPKNIYPEYHNEKKVHEQNIAESPIQKNNFKILMNSACTTNSCNADIASMKGKIDFGSIQSSGVLQGDMLSASKTSSTVEKKPEISKDDDNSESNDPKTNNLESDTKFTTAIVKTSDTMISVCKRLGVDADDISNLIYGSGIDESRFDLRIGQRVDVSLNQKRQLQEMRIHDKGGFTYKSFNKEGDGYIYKEKDYPHSVENIEKEFRLGSDFVNSAEGIGLTRSEALYLNDKLNDRVNFKKLSPNTIVKVDLTQTVINHVVNKFVVNAVQLSSSDFNLTAINYNGNLYDQKGISLSPSFLRHPLAGKVRVTSHFSLNRMHPILHYRRPHWGTDYGCPIGTPILAISDAKVIRSGRVRGFGNMVMLKHPHHIETIAAHMIRIAKGIHVGTYVKKGQVIGYVGKTGLSTGPHLHFEMRVNGKRVDSLKVKLPIRANVSQEKKFKKLEIEYSEKFSNI
ncbi:peptidoglycan DD-metalloendopeptidase family protein [Photobacterium damselae]|uniref:peptidoglycan DD-metalloendopeptidase family protein n=1 Tax=Photobacterium damselae TaxID=38293 RepID=UPI0040698B5D